MIHHKAQCKFCQREITLEIDEDCPPIHIEKWLPIAACNRCADYHRDRGKVVRPISHICGMLSIIHANHGDSVSEDVIGVARGNLVRLTKRLAEIMSDFYFVQNFWQEDFVNQLIEQPMKCRVIIAVFEKTVRNLSDLPKPAAPERELRPTTNDP